MSRVLASCFALVSCARPSPGAESPTPPPPSAGMLGVELAAMPGAVACDGTLDRGALVATSPVTHVLVTIPVGRTCVIPAIAGIDAFVVVLDGTGSAEAVGGSQPYPLQQWDVLHTPGLGVSISTRTLAATVAIAIATTDGTALALTDAPPWTTRPGTITKVALGDVEELAWGDDGFRARIAFGAPEVSTLGVTLLRVGAGKAIAPHEHESWELVTALDGVATMQVGDSEIATQVGKPIAIPAKTQHAAQAGEGDVLILQSYAPAGAEQRFRKLATDAAAPSK